MLSQIMVMVMMMMVMAEAMVERHLYNCHAVNGHLLPRRTDLEMRANCRK